MSLVLAQVGATYSLGHMLIAIVVLIALWAVFIACARQFNLPSLAVNIAHIVIGAVVVVIAIKVLLSLL